MHPLPPQSTSQCSVLFTKLILLLQLITHKLMNEATKAEFDLTQINLIRAFYFTQASLHYLKYCEQ